MAPLSQEKEPPANPGRFKPGAVHLCRARLSKERCRFRETPKVETLHSESTWGASNIVQVNERSRRGAWLRRSASFSLIWL